MIMIQLGISSGWSSPYLAKLTAPGSPLPLSLYQASWVASLLNLGRFGGAFLGAALVNCVGSKQTLFLTLAPISACWILTMLAQSAEWLYLARLCGGIGLGMTYSSFPLYLGEVTLPKIRGAIVSLAACGGTFGIMMGNLLGSYLDLEKSAAIYLVPCLALMLLFIWLPESPHHLVKGFYFLLFLNLFQQILIRLCLQLIYLKKIYSLTLRFWNLFFHKIGY